MPHTITIAPGGQTCQAQAGETLLQAVRKAGFSIPYSCRSGICGACKGAVLDGEVDHGNADASILPPQERAQGKALFCCAVAKTDVIIKPREFEVTGALGVKRISTRVRAIDKIAADVVVLKLQLPVGKSFPFLAGQYLDILLRDGRRRSFSMANRPESDGISEDGIIELHVRHLPGGVFSSFVFDGLAVRDTIEIEGPHGNFHLRAEQNPRPAILLAGGTGFAPAKAIVEDEISRGSLRPLYLYRGARSRDGLYLHELCMDWASRHSHIRYLPVVSDDVADWSGRTGPVHQAVLDDFADLHQCEVYACGPEPMIAAARIAFGAKGLAETDFHFDAFVPSGDQAGR